METVELIKALRNFVNEDPESYFVEEAADRLEQMQTKLDAAESCIYAVEDALDRGANNDWAREAIREWEEGADHG